MYCNLKACLAHVVGTYCSSCRAVIKQVDGIANAVHGLPCVYSREAQVERAKCIACIAMRLT